MASRFLPLTVFLLFVACTNDSLGEPQMGDCDNLDVTYVSLIKPIIDESCAYSNCHLDTAPGIYTSYNGLLPSLENGEFRNRVLNLKDDPTLGMPPDFSPANKPSSLTEDQLNLIRCWLDNNFPEE
ncbi:MAG: hypothetical protein KTR30_18890 [Saprospiraceae bacterium]|nr:hypothetical protein [Saprospiraceae bacterium]